LSGVLWLSKRGNATATSAYTAQNGAKSIAETLWVSTRAAVDRLSVAIPRHPTPATTRSIPNRMSGKNTKA
jgi:hypothetical protein